MNPYINIPIATNMGININALIASYSCDASIAVSGQYGPLSEIAYALQQLDKPIIGLETWGIDGVQEVSTKLEVIEKLNHIFTWNSMRLFKAKIYGKVQGV